MNVRVLRAGLGRLLSLLWLASLAVSAAAAPLPRDQVPDVLRSWVPWVMHGHEMLACTPSHDDPGARHCAWPSGLEIQVGAQGGSFRLDVEAALATTWIALPGGPEQWPQEVGLDGKPAAVVAREGRPMVAVGPGSHTLRGAFAWQEMPRSLRVPPDAGVLRLSIDGRAEPQAAPDAEGRLWLRQDVRRTQEGERLTLRTFRLIDDDIPMRLTTEYEIAVAGAQRELQLPQALLSGFVPLEIDSALPARLDPDGTLRLQVRPGQWRIRVAGRRMSPTAALQLPAGEGRADEHWAFRARNVLRLVSVEGVAAVDPKQVAMPADWRELPAYRVRPGETLRLKESRRGDPQPAPDKLQAARQIWLDFDGGGYSLQDRITGTVSRAWRLEMPPPQALGRVAVDGVDQLITRLTPEAAAGFEVRRGVADILADSRIEGDLRVLPATGWAQDFNGLAATLNLPPGWELVHAGGVDRAQGSWFSRWTLYDFFFVLLAALAAGRLIGWKAGALVLAALALTWQTPGAPKASWILLLAALGLLRVLPEGRLRVWAERLRRAAALLVLLILIPYAVDQVRQAIYPALDVPGWPQPEVAYPRPAAAPAPAPAAAPAPAPRMPAGKRFAAEAEREESAVLDKSMAGSAASAPARASLGQEAAPGARVQTGPGMPDWEWRRYELQWQGPVQQGQEIRLWLVSPVASALLALARVVLLAAALWLFVAPLCFRPGTAAGAGGLAAALLAVAVVGLARPDAALAASGAAPPAPPPQAISGSGVTPPESVLDALRDKLAAAPDCMPACAELARMEVVAAGNLVRLRLEVHAQVEVALPLPGDSRNFRPQQVLLDGRPAALRREADGTLWLRASPGVHQVVMESDVGGAASVQLALPMPPRRVSERLEGWSLSGLDERGQAGQSLQLVRQAKEAGEAAPGAGDAQALPPFVVVTRTVALGPRWTVATRVERMGGGPAPVLVRVPLIEGESVNAPEVRAEAGHAVVNLGTQQRADFASSLPETPRIRLTASREPNQIEVWQMDVSTQWHAVFEGIPVVHHQEGQRWLPRWQPWPGESVTATVTRPAGVEGQTLTLDRSALAVVPGIRATDVSLTLRLRSSQGGQHAVTLPPEATLLQVAIDGATLPIRAEGRRVTFPVVPGTQSVRIDWREPLGIGLRFGTPEVDAGLPGVNGNVQLQVPRERWILFAGGPRLGPAVLFWGVVVVLAAVAAALARFAPAPLGFASWFLLGLGLTQSSLATSALIAGWFVVLAARRRYGERLGPAAFDGLQILIVLWTLAAFAGILHAVQHGLLGYPDMQIAGNGSSAEQLNWYQDRTAAVLPTGWVVSVPVLAYRLLMLAWALWLAAALLRWIRWGWECFSSGGGYWRTRPPRPKAAAPQAGGGAPGGETP